MSTLLYSYTPTLLYTYTPFNLRKLNGIFL